MNKMFGLIMVFATGVMFFLNVGVPFVEASNGIDYDAVRNSSANLSVDELFNMSKEYSVPILIGGFVLSGFMAVAGLVFKPLKMAAGSLIGICLLFFILVNYAPTLAGVMISVVDGVMSRLSGGA